MMELNYLPETSESVGQRRINLWRRTIFLFDITPKEEGPFHQADYKQYYCEGKSDEGTTPDIFGFSDYFFCVCDISMSPQKPDDMKKYRTCKPSEYVLTIFPSVKERESTGDPFLITDVISQEETIEYNSIQIGKPSKLTLNNVNDHQLKEILENWSGFSTTSPSYQLMAVPESSQEELKKPLGGILKWASAQSDWIEIDRAVELLLGHLFKSFSPKSRSELRKNVEGLLSDLSKILDEYLIYDHSEKRFKIEIDVTKPMSRKAFTERLNHWLDTVPLEEFADYEIDKIFEHESEDIE
jgi:hypothetical protein